MLRLSHLCSHLLNFFKFDLQKKVFIYYQGFFFDSAEYLNIGVFGECLEKLLKKLRIYYISRFCSNKRNSLGKTRKMINQRSHRSKVFCKKGVLRNFVKFTGKHLCQSFFFNKVAGAPATLLTKEALTQVFSSEFCEISKNSFSNKDSFSNRTLPLAASITTRIFKKSIFGCF